MNKKLLLSTTVAGTMFIAGMANPSLAATEVRYNSNWVQSNVPSIAIELDVGDKDLSRAELVSVIEKRYSAGAVVKVEKDGTIISDATALVPTGAKVTLSNGKVLTVVTFADVNGDGSITNIDAQNVLEFYSKGSVALNPEQKKAADVADPEGLNLIDAQRILEYYSKTSNFTTHYVDPARLPGDETLAVLGFKADFAPSTSSNDPNYNNQSAITDGKVEYNGTQINVKVNKADLKSSYRDAKYADWVAIDLDLLNLPINSAWTISGVDSEIVTAPTATITNVPFPRIYVDADQDTTTFTLTVNGETATITVNILDTSKPEVVSIVKAEVAEYTADSKEAKNAGLIKEFADMSVTEVKAKYNAPYNTYDYVTDVNVNKMEESSINEVSGNWYKVRVKVKDLNASLVKVVDGDDVTKSYVTEVIDEDELYVWVNALKSVSKLTFVSVNATSTQVTSAVSSNTKTIGVKNEGILGLTGVEVAKAVDTQTDSSRGNSPQKINIDAIESVEIKGNVINVTAPLRNFVAYQFKDEAKSDYTAKMSGNKFVQGGKKYYALVVDLTADTKFTNENMWPATLLKLGTSDSSELDAYRDASASKKDGTVSALNQSILLWLDADQKTTSFEVRGTTEQEGELDQETYKFTVNFVDTSAPFVRALDNEKGIVDVKVATESTLGSDYATNAKATSIDTWNAADGNSTATSTIAIKARKSAMNVIQREDGKTLWYALKVKVNVDRDQLVFKDYPKANTNTPAKYLVGEVTGLADDEIVLWIDANKSTQSFTVYNTNSSSKTLTLTVTTEDVSLAKVTEISVKPVDADLDLRELPGYGEEFAENVANNTSADAITTQGSGSQYKLTQVTESSTTGKALSDNKVRVLQANKNLLKEFNFRLGTGKWIPLVLTLNTTVNVKVEGNIATNEERLALGLSDVGTTVLWVNANTLQKTNNKVTIHTIDDANSGLVEEHTFSFDFTDSSAFPAESQNSVGAEMFDFNNKEWQENFAKSNHFAHIQDETSLKQYYLNQALTKVSSVREGDVVTITVTADWEKLYNLQLNDPDAAPSKVVTFKLDFGMDLVANKYYYKNYITANSDELNLTPDELIAKDTDPWSTDKIDQHWIDDSRNAYGCTNSELYLNRGFIFTQPKSEGHWGTEVLQFAGDSQGKGDKLTFVIKYVQENYNGDLAALRNSFGL